MGNHTAFYLVEDVTGSDEYLPGQMMTTQQVDDLIKNRGSWTITLKGVWSARR